MNKNNSQSKKEAIAKAMIKASAARANNWYEAVKLFEGLFNDLYDAGYRDGQADALINNASLNGEDTV